MISFGSLASLGSLIPAALSLDVASQDSPPKLLAKLPPGSSGSHSPKNLHAVSLNTSLTPAKPPLFAYNASALTELGLDINKSISWMTSASGNAVGVRKYSSNLESFLPLLCDFLNSGSCHSSQ